MRRRARIDANRNKYRNVRTNGYASKREANRAAELQALHSSGIIKGLVEQMSWELLPAQVGERAVHYLADFTYTDADGKIVVEDVKSPATRKLPTYVIKRKLLLWRHGIRIVEI